MIIGSDFITIITNKNREMIVRRMRLT